jgi:hypothetical protein
VTHRAAAPAGETAIRQRAAPRGASGRRCETVTILLFVLQTIPPGL